MRIWSATLKTAFSPVSIILSISVVIQFQQWLDHPGATGCMEHFKIGRLSRQISLWTFKFFNQHNVKLIHRHGWLPSLASWDTVKIQSVNYLWKAGGLEWTVTDGIEMASQLSVIRKLVITSAFMHGFWDRFICYRTFPCQGNLSLWNTLCLHTHIQHSLLVNLIWCLYGLFIGKSSFKKEPSGSEGKHGYH